jgi:hypothetical protein
MARRSTRKMKRSRRSRTRSQRGGANSNNNALVAELEEGMNERLNLNAFNRGYRLQNVENHVANNNLLARRNLPKRVLSANTENTITAEGIKSGNTLVNFRGNAPNSFESKWLRYYKKNTFNQLTKHPQTRGPIVEATEYKAQIGNTNYNSNANNNNSLVENFFTKRAEKGKKKVIYENISGLPH